VDLPDEEFASQYPVVVLFLDEMNSAPPSVQSAAYQLILNRRIGKYRLPDNVVMVAAGNRESDKGVTYRMPTPLGKSFLAPRDEGGLCRAGKSGLCKTKSTKTLWVT
jgi:MoxR-like ATPase